MRYNPDYIRLPKPRIMLQNRRKELAEGMSLFVLSSEDQGRTIL